MMSLQRRKYVIPLATTGDRPGDLAGGLNTLSLKLAKTGPTPWPEQYLEKGLFWMSVADGA